MSIHIFCCCAVLPGEIILCEWGDTHKISRLLVPFRSGNSRIWVAPLRELQSDRKNGVRKLSFFPSLTLSDSYTHICAHRPCPTAHFIPSNFSSKINTGCFGCLTRNHKSHHSTCSYSTLSLTTSACSTAIR